MAKQYYALSDSFEYKGVWWVPEDPSRKVPGILSLRNGNISLALFDSLKPLNFPVHFAGGDVFRPNIINGVTDSGDPCTLLEAFQSSFKYHLSSFDALKRRFEQVFYKPSP